jgi:hypothetical protein
MRQEERVCRIKGSAYVRARDQWWMEVRVVLLPLQTSGGVRKRLVRGRIEVGLRRFPACTGSSCKRKIEVREPVL